MSSAKSVGKENNDFRVFYYSLKISMYLVKQHAKCAIWDILTSQIGFKGSNGIANVPFIFLYH